MTSYNLRSKELEKKLTEYLEQNKISKSKFAKNIGINPSILYKWIKDGYPTDQNTCRLSVCSYFDDIKLHEQRENNFKNYGLKILNSTEIILIDIYNYIISNNKESIFTIDINYIEPNRYEILQILKPFNFMARIDWHQKTGMCTDSCYSDEISIYVDASNADETQVYSLMKLIENIIEFYKK